MDIVGGNVQIYGNLQVGSVFEENLADESVSRAKIEDLAIGSGKIDAAAIETIHLKAGSITASKLVVDEIITNSIQIKDEIVGGVKMTDNATYETQVSFNNYNGSRNASAVQYTWYDLEFSGLDTDVLINIPEYGDRRVILDLNVFARGDGGDSDDVEFRILRNTNGGSYSVVQTFSDAEIQNAGYVPLHFVYVDQSTVYGATHIYKVQWRWIADGRPYFKQVTLIADGAWK